MVSMPLNDDTHLNINAPPRSFNDSTTFRLVEWL